MIKDNNIEAYIHENAISVYDISEINIPTIVIENEKDFLSLVQQHNVKTIYRESKENTTINEATLDLDYEEIYQQFENDYKFLEAISDLLTVDEYCEKLDGIINKHRKQDEPTEFIERWLHYSFLFSDSCCYKYTYYESEGEEAEYISDWQVISNIIADSKSDINEWGHEIVNNIKSEFESFNNQLLVDDTFAKCKNKDSRLLRYDELIDNNYPYLSMYKNELSLMRKLPNFYLSFDKKTRSLYAERAYEKLNV